MGEANVQETPTAPKKEGGREGGNGSMEREGSQKLIYKTATQGARRRGGGRGREGGREGGRDVQAASRICRRRDGNRKICGSCAEA
jgi:hypothetical protein